MDTEKQPAEHGCPPAATNYEERSKKRSRSPKADRKSVKRRKGQPESVHTVYDPVANLQNEIPEKAEGAHEERTNSVTKAKRKKTRLDPEQEEKKSKKRKSIGPEIAEKGRRLEKPKPGSRIREHDEQIHPVFVVEMDGMNLGMDHKSDNVVNELGPNQQVNEPLHEDMPVGDREMQGHHIRHGEVNGVTGKVKFNNKRAPAGISERGNRDSKRQNAHEVTSLIISHKAATTAAEVPANGGSRTSSDITGLDQAAEEVKDSTHVKAQRFICFIGNLPYTTTSASLSSHFSSIAPASIRHITERNDPKRSKGYAFLEFDHYDKMKTCLKLYHHSSFNDGKSPTRRINVQLTAGGGGSKSEGRKEKLRVKNERLGGQRARRAQAEDIKRKKAGRSANGPALTGGVESVAPNAEKRKDAVGNGEIHPSRKPQMKL